MKQTDKTVSACKHWNTQDCIGCLYEENESIHTPPNPPTETVSEIGETRTYTLGSLPHEPVFTNPPTEPTKEKWEEGVNLIVEGAGRDLEVGNIDDKKSFNSWKKSIKKDVLALLLTSVQEAKAEMIAKIVEIVDDLKWDSKGVDNGYWYTRGEDVTKIDIYQEALDDLLTSLRKGGV